jgi:hypothetical protein
MDDDMANRCYDFFFSGDKPDKESKGVDLNSPRLQRILEDAAHYRTLRDVFRELDRGNRDRE